MYENWQNVYSFSSYEIMKFSMFHLILSVMTVSVVQALSPAAGHIPTRSVVETVNHLSTFMST